MNKRLAVYLGLAAAALMIPAGAYLYKENMLTPVLNPVDLIENIAEQCDHQPGYAIEIKDNEGKIVSMAARGVSVGDEIIHSDGSHYRISRVSGKEATAKFLGADKDFLAYNQFFSNMEVPVAAMGNKNNLIGIYHSHTDESYVPTDGKEAIPFKGGIYQVGASLANKLRNENVQVIQDKTPHDPHDNNAYYRSRRTATRLMKNNPVAIIDVHRDGIPDAGYYRRNISDQNVTQLRLVIGRQNPNMRANLDFAKRMMAYSNKVHPGIVKEIFMGKGNYNQDLMPTALLIEAGTHTNSKQEAEKGVALFADAIPTVLGVTPTAPGGGAGGPGVSGSWRALAWILGLTIAGGAAFLLISSGGLGQAKSRLSSYIGREFTGFMGPIKGGFGRIFGARARKPGGASDAEYDPDKNEIDRENLDKIRRD